MAHNVNVMIDSESDGTTRNNVPDWVVSLSVNWIDDAGDAQSWSGQEYLLVALNWLRTNYPGEFKRQMEELVFLIARLRYGVDSVEGLD